MSARAALVLAGRRIAITRPADQAVELQALLRSRGAEPLPYPTIEIASPVDDYVALDGAIRSIARYDWVAFTSQNAVAAFADRAESMNVTIPRAVRLAAVGEATARAVRSRLGAVDFIPSAARAESLAMEIPDIAERRVLFPRGDLASDTLGRVLRSRGALVEEVIAYRTVPGAGTGDLADQVRRGEIDAILFMSASSIRHLLDALDDMGPATHLSMRSPAIICIGAETARVAREAGIEVSAVATERTTEGVVDALERWFGRGDDGTGS
jgi:uroporphyrinogen-III synthase